MSAMKGCRIVNYAAPDAKQVEIFIPYSMTLEQAVEILNKKKHEGASTYHILRFDDGSALVQESTFSELEYTPFEAICIAEGYQRLDQQVEKY